MYLCHDFKHSAHQIGKPNSLFNLTIFLAFSQKGNLFWILFFGNMVLFKAFTDIEY